MDGVQPLPNLPVADLFSRCPLSGDWNLSLERMHLLVGGLATEFAPWIGPGVWEGGFRAPTNSGSQQAKLAPAAKKWRIIESPKRFWTPKIVTGSFAVQQFFCMG